MARVFTVFWALLTVVLFVVSGAFAVDILLVDGAGIEFVDHRACEEVSQYYTQNELECDGFVLWLLWFAPMWVVVGPVWLFYLAEPRWRSPKASGRFERGMMAREVRSRR